MTDFSFALYKLTKNTFSQIHNDQALLMTGCIAHAQNGHMSTSGQKSDVTIVFLDPDFLEVAKISAIRVYLRQI